MKNIHRGLFQRLCAEEEAVLRGAYGPEGVRRELPDAEGFGELSGFRLERTEARATLTERFAPKPRLILFGGGMEALIEALPDCPAAC